MSPYATAFRRHLAALVVVSLLAAVPLVLLASRNSGGSSDNAGVPQMALVAAGPARVRVKEIPLSGDDVIAGGTGGVGRPGMALLPRTTAAMSEERVLTSTPQTASGYATVGVTWALNPQEKVGDVVLLVRTRNDGGAWSEWVDFEYDAAHGPDVKSAAGRGLRAGTDPFPVGEVALVQVRVVVNKGGRLPRDIRLSIIDPGSPRLVRREIVRPKYRHRLDRSRPPLVAPAPARVVPGGYASAGLLAWVALSKYVDHVPLYAAIGIKRPMPGGGLCRVSAAGASTVTARHPA